MENSIQIEHVSKVYRQGELEVRALHDVTLTLPHKSFACICGPSGSGKTTLLNIIGALDVPDGGVVTVFGRSLAGLSRSELSDMRRDHLGFIFQSYNLIPVLSAAENVEFVLQLQGESARQRREKSYEMLEAVGLKGLEKRRPAELSGGQQQRVAVARAMVTSPEVILADEPTANLDTASAEGLIELMQKMNEERGVTFVFSTHDRRIIEHAKRVIRLVDGEVVEDRS